MCGCVVYVGSCVRSCSRGVCEMAQKEERREGRETRKREGDEARIDVVWRINFRLDHRSPPAISGRRPRSSPIPISPPRRWPIAACPFVGAREPPGGSINQPAGVYISPHHTDTGLHTAHSTQGQAREASMYVRIDTTLYYDKLYDGGDAPRRRIVGRYTDTRATTRRTRTRTRIPIQNPESELRDGTRGYIHATHTATV